MLLRAGSHPGAERLLPSGSSERPAGIEPFTFKCIHLQVTLLPSTSQDITLRISAT